MFPNAYYLLLSAYGLVPEQPNGHDARFWGPPWVYVASVGILDEIRAKREKKNVEVIYRLPPGSFALTGVPRAFTTRM